MDDLQIYVVFSALYWLVVAIVVAAAVVKRPGFGCEALDRRFSPNSVGAVKSKDLVFIHKICHVKK
jgi:hypothetical protein